MFCSNCGRKIGEGIKYCPYCGQAVDNEKNTPDNSHHVGGTLKSQKDIETPKSANLFLWLVPLWALFVAFFAVGGYWLYELKIDKDVTDMTATGEVLALSGDLEGAQRYFKQGLLRRPNNKTLLINLQVIEEGQHFEDLLKKAQQYLGNENYTSAFTVLNEVERQTTSKEGAFYEQFQQKVLFQYANTMIAALDRGKDVIELPYQLEDVIGKLEGFEGEEVVKLQNEIFKKAVDIAYNNAQKYLQLNQFTEAVKEVDKGLTYDMNNDKLLAFKDTITQAKKSYEEAESKRIEKAMQQAAQEDLANRTEAVYLVSWDYYYDYDYNYLSLWGQVQNIGTRPISLVKVHYSAYDTYGQFLGRDEGYIYPGYLMPKENGDFEQGHYVYADVGNIIIDYFTWYVE